MADTVLMNLIIAVISFGRRDALLKRRKRVGEESRASLCRSFGDVPASLGAVCLQADLSCCPPVPSVMVWRQTHF